MLIEKINWLPWLTLPNCAFEFNDLEIACIKIEIKELKECHFEILRRSLNNTELEKANKYKKELDQKLYVAGHGVLNLIIKDITGQAQQLNYTEHGKPYLENSEIEFSITHSGEIALIALTKKIPIGIDIEHVLTIQNKDELLVPFFHEQEKLEIIGINPLESELAFYSCWTRKEAVLKAMGDGLSIDTKSFYVGSFVVRNSNHLRLPNDYPSIWGVWDFMIGNDYIACIATPRETHQPTFFSFSANNLCS